MSRGRLLGAEGLNDRQRLGLAHARRRGQIDNLGYRVLTGCDDGTATQELTDLRRQRLLGRTGGRRWAAWRLRYGAAPRICRGLDPGAFVTAETLRHT